MRQNCHHGWWLMVEKPNGWLMVDETQWLVFGRTLSPGTIFTAFSLQMLQLVGAWLNQPI